MKLILFNRWQYYDMKILNFLLILILVTSCSKENIRKTDLELMNLNGKVKFIKVFQYKAILRNGVIEKEKVDNSKDVAYVDNQVFFNKKGMIQEQREYISDKLNHKYLFHYDKDLNITKKEYFNSLGELINESDFENIYNSNGELIEEREIMKGEQFKSNWIQKIFKDKNVITKNEYLDTEIYKSYEYQYDNNGNRIIENRYNKDGTLSIQIMTSFNNNNRIKEIMLDGNGETFSQERYEFPEFDSNNNWKTILIFKDNVLTNLIEFETEYYN